MTMNKKFIYAGIGILVLIVAGVFIFSIGNNQNVTEVISDTKGSDESVTIKAYLNLAGCSPEITDLLKQLTIEYQGQITVEYIDFSTREGYEQTVRDGISCQTLVINGKQTYTIKYEDGTSREVTFSHPIGQQYTADDVKTVVNSILGDKYD